MSCDKCSDRGYYLDRRCNNGECAHPKANISPMDCPQRPCACLAGKAQRAELNARIIRQNALLSPPEVSRSRRLTAIRGESYRDLEEAEAPTLIA